MTSDVVHEQHTSEIYNLYYSVILFNAVVAAERITVRRRCLRHRDARHASHLDAAAICVGTFPFALLYINDYQETIVCVVL